MQVLQHFGVLDWAAAFETYTVKHGLEEEIRAKSGTIHKARVDEGPLGADWGGGHRGKRKLTKIPPSNKQKA